MKTIQLKKLLALMFSLVAVTMLITSCNLPESMIPAENDTVTITAPVDGTQLSVGQVVDVVSLIENSDGASAVRLLVNGDEARLDKLNIPMQSGNMYQPWQPEAPGTYTLQVRAGDVESNTVTVIVGEASVDAATPTTLSEITTTPGETSTAETPTATSTVEQIADTPVASATTPPQATTQVSTATNTPVTPTFTATVVANGSISGFLLRDENGNGNINPADSRLANVTIRIAGGACPLAGLTSTTSNSNGEYTFSGLASGQYCVEVVESTLPSIGGSWQASLPNPRTVTLGAGENKGGQNFAFQPFIE